MATEARTTTSIAVVVKGWLMAAALTPRPAILNILNSTDCARAPPQGHLIKGRAPFPRANRQIKI
jgi:hypothetical protein